MHDTVPYINSSNPHKPSQAKYRGTGYHPHFTDEGTEAQRWMVVGQIRNPGTFVHSAGLHLK